MKVLGIITEYNPMHNGHIYHLNESKKITSSDYTILVMSGSFTQTGNIAILDKFTRAKLAVENGVDLVIELPTIYATASSEYFSFGAVKLLQDLKIIDSLCFGSECENLDILNNISNVLIQKEEEIWKDIKNEDKNITFATARNNVLKKYLNDDEINEISKPNNILGIEYLKSLKKLKSNIKPYIIKRVSSNYNELALNNNEFNFTSATSIRTAIKNNEIDKIQKYIPDNVFEALNKYKNSINSDLYDYIRLSISNMSLKDLSEINEITEGLENKIYKEIINFSDYDSFIKNIKSKRYIENKIKRIMINILLKINKKDFNSIVVKAPTYAHILAMSPRATTLLSEISKCSKIPVITSLSDTIIEDLDENIHKMIKLDILAANIRSIISKENINIDYTNKLK